MALPTFANDNVTVETANQKLPALREHFNKGLQPGEYMIVKSKFTSVEGNSGWMWVAVVKWQGERITGILQNQPNANENLSKGAEVTVEQSGIFDYIHYLPDSSTVGNETGKLMSKGQ